MDERQKMRELERIIFEISKDELTRYFGSKQQEGNSTPASKIAFQNVYGDLVFLNWKYILKGDGDGGGTIYEEMAGNNTWKKGISFDFPNEAVELYVAHPEREEEEESAFRKSNATTVAHVKGEEILHNEISKKSILQMIQDIAPERLDEVKELFA